MVCHTSRRVFSSVVVGSLSSIYWCSAVSTIQLSEILTKNISITNSATQTVTDWVEIRNTSVSEVRLAGYSLTDSLTLPSRWSFPEGATLKSEGFVLVALDSDRPATLQLGSTLNTGFSLKSTGDEIFLTKVDGTEFEIVDRVEFGVQVADLSIARLGSTGAWGLAHPTPNGPNQAAALGDPRRLRINEWMASSSRGEDWIELFNGDDKPVALEGLFLSDEKRNPQLVRVPSLSFIGTESLGFAVFMADGQSDKRANHLKFKLSANGEEILLSDTDGTLIDSVKFGPQQPDFCEGRLPDGAASIVRLTEDGTFGQRNLLPLDGVVINEVLSHSDDPLEDAIELQNLRAESLDISGWYLSDNVQKPTKFKIPPGSVLEPGGFKVFYRYQFQYLPGVAPSFGFNSAHGDDLYLYSADEAGKLDGYRTGVFFASAPNGVSFGRHMTSLGPRFDLMNRLTMGTDITPSSPPDATPLFRLGLGETNDLPLVEPVVISEIMYHPKKESGENQLEYIEIRNVMGTNVPLYDLIFFTNTFQLTGAVEFRWPTNAVLAPHQAMIVVGFDPQADQVQLQTFRQHYEVPDSVEIFGPFAGKLDNNGESLLLYRPDIPQFCFDADFGFVAPILVDQIDYQPVSPWPTAANNPGISLQRKRLSRFGNDPENWYAGLPTAGRDNGVPGGNLPQATTETHLTYPAGSDAYLTVECRNGAESCQIQWRFNGAPMHSSAGNVLPLLQVTPSDSGTYSALVSNPFGSTNLEIFVRVEVPPVITKQPQSIQLPDGDTAIMTVAARGTPPFRYQWSKDATTLPGATNSTLILSNLSGTHAGSYQVMISTSAGQVESTTATVSLLHLSPPCIVVQPRGEDFRAVTPILPGGSFTLNVTAAGEPPLAYQWRHNGAPIVGAHRNTYELLSFNQPDLGHYDVEVRNAFGVVISSSVEFGFLRLPTVEILTPDRIVANPGDDVPFPIVSSGTPRLYFRWHFNGTEIPAEYCENFSRLNVHAGDAGVYEVRCFNKRGEVVLGTGWSKAVELVVRPKITNIQKIGNVVRLRLQITRGRSYDIESGDELGNWRRVGVAQGGLSATVEAELPAQNARGFYRLVESESLDRPTVAKPH